MIVRRCFQNGVKFVGLSIGLCGVLKNSNDWLDTFKGEIMKKFEEAWNYVKENEGGYVNDKNDKGGATKYGISLRFLKGLERDEGDINGDGEVDIKDIRGISEEEAKAFYETHFWNQAKCERLKDRQIAIKVFDMCVNFGVNGGIRILQKAVNKMYEKYVLTVDGKIGPRTLEAVNNAEPRKLMKYVVMWCENRYKQLVFANQDYERYLKGWLRRAKRIPV